MPTPWDPGSAMRRRSAGYGLLGLAAGSDGAAPGDTGADCEDALAAKTLVRTRDEASDGHHQALAAHQTPRPAHQTPRPARQTPRPARHVDPASAQAIEPQTRAPRELGRPTRVP
ncbi:hypothetical protein ACFZCU_42030 [Streptomyces canus]|uniref:hypothetical protein n=1 Tax=Streptomyces canus TaxID=58343 RepID=UPI0036E5B58C